MYTSNCSLLTIHFMTNETYQNCTKFILMKIHKYTNILKVISLNYNPYNSCNHFSKSWGCKILCVYMQSLVLFIVNTPISIDQGLHVSTIQKQGRHIISMPQSRRDYNIILTTLPLPLPMSLNIVVSKDHLKHTTTYGHGTHKWWTLRATFTRVIPQFTPFSFIGIMFWMIMHNSSKFISWNVINWSM
jgi:hypothetical protein